MKQLLLIMAFIAGFIPQGNAQEPFFKESLNGIKRIELTASTRMNVVIGTANEISFKWGAPCDDCDEKQEHEWSNWDDHDDNDDHDNDRTQKRKDRSEGLTAIYANGKDNTGMGMSMERDGDVLRIRDLKPITQRRAFTVTIPKNINLNVDTSTLGSVHIEDFAAELEIKSNIGHVTLVNVTGPVTASTSTGMIEVIFSTVSQSAPISLTTATGTIDVAIPASTKADVELSSTMGTVYSNFDLVKPRTDGLRNVSGERKIKGQLNNGGVRMNLSSSTGNIYLRKK